MRPDALTEAATTVARDCMAVRAGETVTVVTDYPTFEVGEALRAACQNLGAEVVFTVMAPRRVNGEEPPAPVAAAMVANDVLLLATHVSLSHTRARKEASQKGVRCASLPGVTPALLARTMAVDYNDIAKRTRALAEALADVKYFRLTSAAGSDLVINVAGCKMFADTGLYHEKGAFGNLPAGEVCTAPVLDGSTGVAVFDGSFAGVGLLKKPISIRFQDGVAVGFDGEADKLREILTEFGTGADVLAEIGIGTHPAATLTGIILEDEKIYGSVHLALGNNVALGGTNDVALHLDGVILKPTLETDDGRVLIAAGVPEF